MLGFGSVQAYESPRVSSPHIHGDSGDRARSESLVGACCRTIRYVPETLRGFYQQRGTARNSHGSTLPCLSSNVAFFYNITLNIIINIMIITTIVIIMIKIIITNIFLLLLVLLFNVNGMGLHVRHVLPELVPGP